MRRLVRVDLCSYAICSVSGAAFSGRNYQQLLGAGSADGGNPVLPAVGLAMCVAHPNPLFPATNVSEEVPNHDDPCVVWREYFSLEFRRPYYHCLMTNETTFDIPDGFVTRFPTFHRRQKLHVNEENRVFRASAPSSCTTGGCATSGCVGSGGGAGGTPTPGGSPLGDSSASSSFSRFLRVSCLKKQLVEHGAGGLLLYLIVHNAVLAVLFFSLYFLRIDIVGYARYCGINVTKEKEVPEDDLVDTTEAHNGNKGRFRSFWSALGVSIVLNKFLVPLELAITLVLAPRFASRLQPFAGRVFSYVKDGVKCCWFVKSS
uniref:WW domain-containing protein n=1 Tax=Trypanosoma congolense (strain IL3000) TaxID=1068625 RepID=G0UYJ9_TRYCI|nr:conserved hypothetical protein [Trypanosoma congolense IL3000]